MIASMDQIRELANAIALQADALATGKVTANALKDAPKEGDPT